MKIIDIYNKVANGEEVPHFIIDEIEFYIGADGFLKNIFGDEVEWTVDKEWLNEEVQIIEEVEEDEFEDIEEIDVEYDNDGKISRVLNQLIKNQKKIINKIKDK